MCCGGKEIDRKVANGKLVRVQNDKGSETKPKYNLKKNAQEVTRRRLQIVPLPVSVKFLGASVCVNMVPTPVWFR